MKHLLITGLLLLSIASISLSQMDPAERTSNTTYSITGGINLQESSDMMKKYKKDGNPDMPEFGGKLSMGVAVGGGGILGIPVRFYATKKFAFEFTPYYRPRVEIIGESDIDVYHHPMFMVGIIYYPGERYSNYKQKLQLNGISIRAGRSIGGYPETIAVISWAKERFKKSSPNRSFSTELGIGLLTYQTYGEYYTGSYREIVPVLNWRINWSWFPK